MSKARNRLSATQKSINRRAALMGTVVVSAAASLPIAKAARAASKPAALLAPSSDGLAIIAAATAYRAVFAAPAGASDEESDAASDRQAAIVDPARERILSNPAASIADLAILAAHEYACDLDGDWGSEDAAGTKALIAAVLQLAGVDPRAAMVG